MPLRQRLMRLIAGALLVALLGACSPEAGRPRGGGLGASGTNIPAGGVTPKSKVFTAQNP